MSETLTIEQQNEARTTPSSAHSLGDMCANCGERWGRHCGSLCPGERTTFTLMLGGVPAESREAAWGAAALMEWLGEHMPSAQKVARGFYSLSAFYDYMQDLTGIPATRHFDSHDHACAAYLDALKNGGDKPAKSIGAILREKLAAQASKTPTLDKLANAAEPKRPALTWNQPTRIDRFAGFSSTYDGPVIAEHGQGLGVLRSANLEPRGFKG